MECQISTLSFSKSSNLWNGISDTNHAAWWGESRILSATMGYIIEQTGVYTLDLSSVSANILTSHFLCAGLIPLKSWYQSFAYSRKVWTASVSNLCSISCCFLIVSEPIISSFVRKGWISSSIVKTPNEPLCLRSAGYISLRISKEFEDKISLQSIFSVDSTIGFSSHFYFYNTTTMGWFNQSR